MVEFVNPGVGYDDPTICVAGRDADKDHSRLSTDYLGIWRVAYIRLPSLPDLPNLPNLPNLPEAAKLLKSLDPPTLSKLSESLISPKLPRPNRPNRQNRRNRRKAARTAQQRWSFEYFVTHFMPPYQSLSR